MVFLHNAIPISAPLDQSWQVADPVLGGLALSVNDLPIMPGLLSVLLSLWNRADRLSGVLSFPSPKRHKSGQFPVLIRLAGFFSVSPKGTGRGDPVLVRLAG